MADEAYSASGVDTAAGDRAVELMRQAVSQTHGPAVIGGVGGFAGLFDVSELRDYVRPILATSTDGVGTKVAIAQAIDKHDTVGQDLVAMIIDDIVVCGAKTLFMTDYIACGKLVPERIAEIVGGIAASCKDNQVALVGGETAEHPGLLAPEEYDLAGAAVGVVEHSNLLGPSRVREGDIAIGVRSSGLHANGFSLVRKIVADRKLDYLGTVPEFPGRTLGEELLVPTQIYSSAILQVLGSGDSSGIRAMAHVTGGGIADNVARVLPDWATLEITRSSWSPNQVFRVLAGWAQVSLRELESTWNLGLGFVIIADPEAAPEIQRRLKLLGNDSWQLGRIERSDSMQFISSKGVVAGTVVLTGDYQN